VVRPVPAGVAAAPELAQTERAETGAVITLGSRVIDLDEYRFGRWSFAAVFVKANGGTK
jgi:hypothetical protein